MLRWRHIGSFFFVLFYYTVCQPAFVQAKAVQEYFRIYELQVEGTYIDYLMADIDGDGLKDGLFFHSKEQANQVARYFSVFYQRAEGFNRQADDTFEIDPGAVVYDFADVDPAPGKEILFFKNQGLYYYRLTDGHYERKPYLLLQTASVFSLPDKWYLERLDFVRDLNQDGIEEILVPQSHHYVIYSKQVDGTYGVSARLDCPMRNSVKSLYEVSRYLVATYLTPVILVVDYNRDRRTDIVTVHDDYLKVFFQSEDGQFSNNDAVIVPLNFILTQAYTTKIGNANIYQRDRFRDKIGLTALTDLNNDGLLDMILEKFSIKEGAFNPKKQFQIFFAVENPENPRQGGIFKKVPDHIIINRGFQLHCKLGDLNNDNKKDIYIPIIEMGVFKFITMLVTGDLDITVLWYVMDDSGKYRKKPDFEMQVTVEVDTRGRKFPVSNIDGDFNGDGRNDFLRAQDGRLMIHYAPDDGKPKETPDVEFAVELPDNGKRVIPMQVNADAKSDVVMVFEPNDQTVKKGKVVILINN